MEYIILPIIGYVVQGIIMSVVVGNLAATKGWTGFRVYGFFFGVLTLIYVAGLPLHRDRQVVVDRTLPRGNW